jgi:hypothetical protein
MSSVQDRSVMMAQASPAISATLVKVVAEWFGFVSAGIGAITLALNVPWSGYGWYAFLCSNIAWVVYAAKRRIWSILLMQLVFATTSLVGIHRWLATDQHHEIRETSCSQTRQAP